MSPVSCFMFTFLSALYCQIAFALWYHFLRFCFPFDTFPEFLPCVHSWRERNSSESLEESRQVDATIYLMSSQAGGPLMPWNVTLPDRSAWQFHSVGFLMSLQVINCHCWFDDDYVNCGHFDSSPTLPFHSFENMVWACTVWRELNTGNLVSLTQCQQCRPPQANRSLTHFPAVLMGCYHGYYHHLSWCIYQMMVQKPSTPRRRIQDWDGEAHSSLKLWEQSSE